MLFPWSQSQIVQMETCIVEPYSISTNKATELTRNKANIQKKSLKCVWKLSPKDIRLLKSFKKVL